MKTVDIILLPFESCSVIITTTWRPYLVAEDKAVDNPCSKTSVTAVDPLLIVLR